MIHLKSHIFEWTEFIAVHVNTEMDEKGKTLVWNMVAGLKSK